jgi:hypothetical protein
MAFGRTDFGTIQAVSTIAATHADRCGLSRAVTKDCFNTMEPSRFSSLILYSLFPLPMRIVGFRTARSSLPLCNPPFLISSVWKIRQPYFDFIHMRGWGFWVHALFVLVGLLSWTNNLRQTNMPQLVFGHDIFDSTNHVHGFIAYKLVLLNSWVIIYALVGFYSFDVLCNEIDIRASKANFSQNPAM